jgi:hypothetical protein
MRAVGGVVEMAVNPMLDELAERGKIDDAQRDALGAVSAGLGAVTDAVAEIPLTGKPDGLSKPEVVGGIISALVGMAVTFFGARRHGERRRSRGVGAIAAADRLAELEARSGDPSTTA